MALGKRPTKFIFVTGGVMSGLGKGITAASIGKILKARGLSVNIQKLDPYLNTDAGTLNPSEHGEVFVTKDGAETDLDLGHYERFLDEELNEKSSIMSGRILAKVIADERTGEYLGKTVQIIPHVTNAMQDAIESAAEGFDVHIVEVGGTVGDYEGLAFVEAIRAMRYRVGRKNVMYVHLVFLPYISASREVKTKPAQNAVRNLRALGINPDVLIARSDHPADEKIVKKLSIYCDVPPEGILPLQTVDSVYRVPLIMEEAGLGTYISERLDLGKKSTNLGNWRKFVSIATDKSLPEVKIGVVAKYMDNEDTYTSVFEALKAAAWHNGVRAKITWIDAEKVEKQRSFAELDKMDGIVVPGGFGSRGLEGKIKAAQYSLKTKKPYLGLCLGMQMGVIALARNVIDKSASTPELDPDTEYPVISLMADQNDVTEKGGTMRLGNYPCVFDPKSKTRAIYGEKQVQERHRHRYEFNNEYRDELTKHGLRLSGLSPDGKLVEIIEIDNHPFFIASQFHPEFKSRPDRPHPMFDGFMAAVKKQLK